MTLLTSLVLLFLLTCVTGSTFAQNIGLPPFNSFSNAGGGIDAINLANLNVHLSIPMRSLGAYGPKASAELLLDSLVTRSGSNINPPTSVDVAASTRILVQNITHVGGFNCAIVSSTATGVLDSHNTYHTTPQLILNGCGASGATAPGSDGWSIVGTTNATGEASWYPVAPNGDNTWRGITTTDAHGNSVNGSLSLAQSSSGVIGCGALTNALGNTVLQGNTCTASSTVQFTYPGPTGTTPQYVLTFTNKPSLGSFGCTSTTPVAGATWWLTSMTFPDQSSMSFTYESVYNDATKTTGRIASVTLRTGALITYDYTGYGTNGINCGDGSTAGFKKITPDGTWTFTHSAPSGTNKMPPPRNPWVTWEGRE